MKFVFELSHKIESSFKRFPLTLSIAIFGSFFLIGIFGIDDYDIIEKYESLIFTLILSISWCISIQYVSEILEHKSLNRFLLKGLAILALIGFYYYFEKNGGIDKTITGGQWSMLFLAGHLFLVFAPFLNIWNKYKFWNYLKSIIISVLRSILYSFILYLGLSLAVVALEFLFDIDFNQYIYLQLLIFCLGIVNTLVYLSDFPNIKEIELEVNFNKAIEVLVKFILIPLSLLYLLIVYLYAVKIVVEWELPKGWVTYLITALSLLGFVIHIIIEPVREKHQSLIIRRFFPFYFYAILPLLTLLFIALYKRISDYNFTELRYLGVVLAIWIAGILLYMLFSKKKSLSLYAKTLFFLVLLSTFGPLSAFKISLNAQVNEFQSLFNDLKSKDKTLFSSVEFERFSNIIRYIYDRNAFEKIKPMIGFNPKEAFPKTGKYSLPKKIADTLNIKILSDASNNNNLYNYSLYNFKSNFAEEITEFTHYTELRLNKEIDYKKALQIYYKSEGIISFRTYGELLFETNIASQLSYIANTYDIVSQAPQDEFTFRLKNKKGDFLLIFRDINYISDDNGIDINGGLVMLFYRTYESLELP